MFSGWCRTNKAWKSKEQEEGDFRLKRKNQEEVKINSKKINKKISSYLYYNNLHKIFTTIPETVRLISSLWVKLSEKTIFEIVR